MGNLFLFYSTISCYISVLQLISVIALSICGRFLAGGCRNGAIIVWDLIKKDCVLRYVYTFVNESIPLFI